ncbi:MAG TPA: cytochrome c [Anaerolineales bacterium]|jgi:mono/diheme cytochrome c family protein|nr:cytochrome c [Anaerolineales bacterium]HQX17175.1 cytochrome c [Anaerolineales bacterium]
MISKFRISLVLALLLTLAIAVPVYAGGWAVITLDELPTGVIAGESFTVGFTVLQHGITPMTDLDPTILAVSPDGEKFIVLAKPEGKPGHYAATLTFPTKGKWNWTIQAFTMEQKMPVLSVAAPSIASAPGIKAEPVKESSTSLLLIVRWLALGLGLIGLTLAFRRKSRLAVALTALCLTVGIGSFITGSAVPAVEAGSESPVKVANVESLSQVELGQQLFVAKGCITCHTNAKVSNSSDYWTIDFTGATNLTNFSASPEILRIRLKNPKDAKSDTQMPNLGLSDAEIEALIAFINSK